MLKHSNLTITTPDEIAATTIIHLIITDPSQVPSATVLLGPNRNWVAFLRHFDRPSFNIDTREQFVAIFKCWSTFNQEKTFPFKMFLTAWNNRRAQLSFVGYLVDLRIDLDVVGLTKLARKDQFNENEAWANSVELFKCLGYGNDGNQGQSEGVQSRGNDKIEDEKKEMKRERSSGTLKTDKNYEVAYSIINRLRTECPEPTILGLVYVLPRFGDVFDSLLATAVAEESPLLGILFKNPIVHPHIVKLNESGMAAALSLRVADTIVGPTNYGSDFLLKLHENGIVDAALVAGAHARCEGYADALVNYLLERNTDIALPLIGVLGALISGISGESVAAYNRLRARVEELQDERLKIRDARKLAVMAKGNIHERNAVFKVINAVIEETNELTHIKNTIDNKNTENKNPKKNNVLLNVKIQGDDLPNALSNFLSDSVRLIEELLAEDIININLVKIARELIRTNRKIDNKNESESDEFDADTSNVENVTHYDNYNNNLFGEIFNNIVLKKPTEIEKIVTEMDFFLSVVTSLKNKEIKKQTANNYVTTTEKFLLNNERQYFNSFVNFFIDSAIEVLRSHFDCVICSSRFFFLGRAVGALTIRKNRILPMDKLDCRRIISDCRRLRIYAPLMFLDGMLSGNVCVKKLSGGIFTEVVDRKCDRNSVNTNTSVENKSEKEKNDDKIFEDETFKKSNILNPEKVQFLPPNNIFSATNPWIFRILSDFFALSTVAPTFTTPLLSRFSFVRSSKPPKDFLACYALPGSRFDDVYALAIDVSIREVVGAMVGRTLSAVIRTVDALRQLYGYKGTEHLLINLAISLLKVNVEEPLKVCIRSNMVSFIRESGIENKTKSIFKMFKSTTKNTGDNFNSQKNNNVKSVGKVEKNKMQPNIKKIKEPPENRLSIDYFDDSNLLDISAVIDDNMSIAIDVIVREMYTRCRSVALQNGKYELPISILTKSAVCDRIEPIRERDPEEIKMRLRSVNRELPNRAYGNVLQLWKNLVALLESSNVFIFSKNNNGNNGDNLSSKSDSGTFELYKKIYSFSAYLKYKTTIKNTVRSLIESVRNSDRSDEVAHFLAKHAVGYAIKNPHPIILGVVDALFKLNFPSRNDCIAFLLYGEPRVNDDALIAFAKYGLIGLRELDQAISGTTNARRSTEECVDIVKQLCCGVFRHACVYDFLYTLEQIYKNHRIDFIEKQIVVFFDKKYIELEGKARKEDTAKKEVTGTEKVNTNKNIKSEVADANRGVNTSKNVKNDVVDTNKNIKSDTLDTNKDIKNDKIDANKGVETGTPTLDLAERVQENSLDIVEMEEVDYMAPMLKFQNNTPSSVFENIVTTISFSCCPTPPIPAVNIDSRFVSSALSSSWDHFLRFRHIPGDYRYFKIDALISLITDVTHFLRSLLEVLILALDTENVLFYKFISRLLFKIGDISPAEIVKVFKPSVVPQFVTAYVSSAIKLFSSNNKCICDGDYNTNKRSDGSEGFKKCNRVASGTVKTNLKGNSTANGYLSFSCQERLNHCVELLTALNKDKTLYNRIYAFFKNESPTHFSLFAYATSPMYPSLKNFFMAGPVIQNKHPYFKIRFLLSSRKPASEFYNYKGYINAVVDSLYNDYYDEIIDIMKKGDKKEVLKRCLEIRIAAGNANDCLVKALKIVEDGVE